MRHLILGAFCVDLPDFREERHFGRTGINSWLDQQGED